MLSTELRAPLLFWGLQSSQRNKESERLYKREFRALERMRQAESLFLVRASHCHVPSATQTLTSFYVPLTLTLCEERSRAV